MTYLLMYCEADDIKKKTKILKMGEFKTLQEAQENMYKHFLSILKENSMDEQFFKQYYEEMEGEELDNDDIYYETKIERIEKQNLILEDLKNISNFDFIHSENNSEIMWKLFSRSASMFFHKELLSWEILPTHSNIQQFRQGKDAYSILGTCKDFPKLIQNLDDDDLKFINDVLLDYEIGKIDMLCNKDGKYVFAENNKIKFGGFKLTILKWFESLITTDNLIEELTTLPF